MATATLAPMFTVESALADSLKVLDGETESSGLLSAGLARLLDGEHLGLRDALLLAVCEPSADRALLDRLAVGSSDRVDSQAVHYALSAVWDKGFPDLPRVDRLFALLSDVLSADESCVQAPAMMGWIEMMRHDVDATDRHARKALMLDDSCSLAALTHTAALFRLGVED